MAIDPQSSSLPSGQAAEAEFFNHMPLGMARVGLSGQFEFVNQALCRMLGYTSEELVAVGWEAITHPDDHSSSHSFAQKIKALRPGESGGFLEKRYVRKDGTILYARVTSTVRFNENGEPTYLLTQLSEIEDTWRKRRIEIAHRRVLDILTQGGGLDDMLEEITRRTEAADPRIRAVIKLIDPQTATFDKVIAPSLDASVRESLVGLEVQRGTTSCGTAVVENRRVIVEDLQTHADWVDFLELADIAGVRACISEPVIGSDGTVTGVFTLSSATTWGPTPLDIAFCEGMARLVSLAVDRYRMHEALRLSRARFQTMIEHAPEAILLIDPHAERFVEANERVRAVYQIAPDAMLKESLWRFAPPTQPDGRTSRDVLVERIQQAREGQSPVFDFLARTGDGKDFLVEMRLTRLPTATGTLIRAGVIDIASRVRAQIELRASAAQLQTILESIDDAIIATDRQGVITHLNSVAEKLTGVHRDQSIGRVLDTVLKLTEAETGLALESPLPQVLREEETVDRMDHVIVRSQTGDEVFVSERATPIRGEHGRVEGMVLVLRDVTAWREAQERSLQSRKLEAIGQLAGGVAHDFNNLLTSILGNAELLSDNADPSVRKAASMIAVAARRSADVTGQLLRFSHKDAEAKDTLDVHALMYEAVELLRMSLGRHIEMQLDFTAEASSVQGEAGSFQNALLNLCLNARDAILARTDTRVPGRITIATRTPLTEPKTLRIIVSDNGVGMTEEVRAQIFEPFFTTKEVGTGTGLGLSSAYGTVQSMGGSIDVASRVGVGTTFVVDLPLSADSIKTLTPESPPHTAGHGKVLVVDDEDLVRHFVMRAMKTMGYTAVGAANGIDAERLFREQSFDAVILDLVMPKRSGVETFHALRAIDPELPVIIASGYSREHSIDDLLAAGAAGFLSKPFQLAALSQAVRTAFAHKLPQ